MGKIEKICVISFEYPTKRKKVNGTFVDELVCGFARYGCDVVVIAPQSLRKSSLDDLYKRRWIRKFGNGHLVTVYYPLYIDYSYKRAMKLNLATMTQRSIERCVLQQFKKIRVMPDVVYANFLNAGCAAAEVGMLYHLPVFCSYGESGSWTIDSCGIENLKNRLSCLSGYISVSIANMNRLQSFGLLNSNQSIAVFPNGVDHQVFRPMAKAQARKRLGFDEHDVIGIFVGSFDERKGYDRVVEASRSVKNLKMIYIGGSKKIVSNPNTIFEGKVNHDMLPVYLSASDFFVLPTRAEGCCNAILEAMACGLPIISSSQSFNDDILDETFSIRIDPENVAEIKEAIETLCKDQERMKEMSVHAFQKAMLFDIDRRAEAIIKFMEGTMKK